MPDAKVALCTTQLNRLGADGARLEADMGAAGATVEKYTCLSLCFGCSTQIIARFDGSPIAAKTADELVAQVREALA
jgi:uncharacterized protein YuzB (UPF0349 family)